MKEKQRVGAIVAAALAGVIATPSMADGPPDYGLDFVTVGAPGNRPTSPEEVPWQPDLRIGSVPYAYRITKTEVTTRQWFEFVQAYAPYYQENPASSAFTGTWITYSAQAGYSYDPAVADFAIDPSWHMAARYVNWLCNGKAPNQAAFESGAYDTSTFTVNPDGSRNDQLVHNVGVPFWIPTQDEWTKAAFYDPMRNGVGLDGYWLNPNSTDSPPIPGLPSEGGTTNAGVLENPWMPVGSYPRALSPWGLLDISGDASEWTEATTGSFLRNRIVRGTSAGMDRALLFYDRIDTNGWYSLPPGTSVGFRVTSLIPSPGIPAVLMAWFILLPRRRE